MSYKVNYKSQVRSLALKFYPEQLLPSESRQAYLNLNGDAKHKQEIALVKALRNRIEMADSKYEIVGIYHNRDRKKSKNDFFELSYKKGHFHILVRRQGNKRFRVYAIFKLLGIYPVAEDSSLYAKHGAETIDDFSSYSMYLTHETEQAIKDGKHKYKFEELMSNLCDEDLKAIRDGYHHSKLKDKLDQRDWDILANDAYELGLKCGDYDLWSHEYMHLTQRASSNGRAVKEEYLRGLHKGISKASNINRKNILITGMHNIGKSYAVNQALRKMNLSVTVCPAGSGKYDEVTTSTDALTFDDTLPSQALTVMEDRGVILHRRNSGDRPWLGEWTVCTTNFSVDHFCECCVGAHLAPFSESLSEDDRDRVDALKSRMHIFKIVLTNGYPELQQVSSFTRGTKANIAKQNVEVNEFVKYVNKSLLEYYYDKQVTSISAYKSISKDVN